MTNDASELKRYANDLMRLEPKVERQVDSILKKGATNVKNTLREDMSQSRSFKQIARTINYDIEKFDGGIEAQVGPNKHWRAGRLANIAYFGGSRGGGGTVDFDNGIRKELPNLNEHLGRVMRDVL